MILAVLAVLAGCSETGESDDGAETVQIETAAVAFEPPKDWVRLDPAEAIEATSDDDLMAELVSRHGPDSEKMGPVHAFIILASLPPRSQSEFLASEKGVRNGLLAQMEVTVKPEDELPTVSDLEQRYSRDAVRPNDVRLAKISTPVGPAFLAAYTRRTTPVVHAAQLTVDTGAEIVQVNVLSGDLARSEQVASRVAESLERIPRAGAYRDGQPGQA